MHRVTKDEGATAVIVAILMTVLLGMGAIVIDVGSWYAERRQLQNGADAAALAVAPECAAGACDTGTDAGSTAGQYAVLNANDGTATVTEVCGTGPGLAPCSPTDSAGPWDCRPLPSSGPLASAPYVQVRTETLQSGGSDLMPSFFGRVLDPSYDGTTVRACARTSWGAPSSLRSQLPITISLCEFQQYTAGGFAPPPPYPPGYSEERTLYFHNNTDDAPPCPAGPSGADLPGGFGWLDPTDDCQAETDTTNWADDSTGAPAPVECSNAELLAMRGQIIDIPIFDSTNDLNGANGQYHIVGYAAFYLTGYVFPGSKAKSLLTDAFPCGGPDHCISGVFTQDLAPSAGTIGSGPLMGAVAYQMSG